MSLPTIARRFALGLKQGTQRGEQMAYDGFWDAFQIGGERTFYQRAFNGKYWNEEILQPKYKIDTTKGSGWDVTYMFYQLGRSNSDTNYRFDYSLIKDKFDFSAIADASYLFNDSWIKNIDIDLSNATKVDRAFYCGNGGRIQSLRLKITNKCTTANLGFGYNGYLEELEFYDSEIAANMSGAFQRARSLSKNSIISVVRALSDNVTGKTLGMSLTSVNREFETSEGANDGSTSAEWAALVAEKQNWTITLADT